MYILLFCCASLPKKGYTGRKIYTNKCRCHLRKHYVDTNQSQMSKYVYHIALLLLKKTKVQIELCGGLDRSCDLVLRQRYCTWVLWHRLVMTEDRIQPEWPEIIRTAFIPSSHLWPPSTNCEMLRNRWFTFWWRKTAHKYNEWIFPKFFSTVCEQEGTISSLGFNPRASREL